jgi:anti-sigma regulatory factor (Ser/Thr protein kinase)
LYKKNQASSAFLRSNEMAIKTSFTLPIVEVTQVGEARRIAVNLAQTLAFSEAEIGKVAIIIAEIAKNFLKHAQAGELHLRALKYENKNGIEILGLDRGPGMADVRKCLEDGFSTVGTSGTGLGAIARLSDLFDIHSIPKLGTAILSQIWSGQDKDFLSIATKPLEIGVIQLPKPGEKISGDGWAIESQLNRHLILVADGLGSGISAAEASQTAIQTLRENAKLNPKAILELAHKALRKTRGAAVAIAEIDAERDTICFAGIGNITGTIVTNSQRRSLIANNGTIGYQVRKIEEFVYPWSSRSLLIMHSDGLGTQWTLDRYPGLISRHPSLIAGVLSRDYRRARDDVTVLVVR